MNVTKQSFLSLLIGVGIFTLPISSTESATIKEVFEHETEPFIGVEGEIVEGDLIKIFKLAKLFLAQDREIRLIVNSTGGDAIEAMKIGEFVRSTLAQVKIRGDYDNPTNGKLRHCYSACVLILIGAANRQHEGDNEFYTKDGRQIHEKTIPVIGIHRPFFSKEYFSSLSATEAREKYNVLKKITQKYLGKMGAPESFISQMFLIPSDEVKLLPKSDFVDIFPYEAPFLDEWFISRCGKLSDSEIEDFADVFVDRMITKNKEFIPKGMSPGYVEYLIEKGNNIDSCKNKELLLHQRTTLRKGLNIVP